MIETCVLTKKFKESEHNYILKTFYKCFDYVMIKNIKIKLFLNLIKVSKVIQPSKCTRPKILILKFFLNVIYIFLKFGGLNKIKVM
jgi:hypothetical protein